jgi:hypothetical protein
MAINPLQAWHRIGREREAAGLDALLADDGVPYSPVVRAPQAGKAVTRLDLGAALQVLGDASLRSVRQIVGPRDAAMAFEVVLDGMAVSGVDLLRFDREGRIVEFKVPIRPLKAIDRVQRRMAAALRAPSPPPPR